MATSARLPPLTLDDRERLKRVLLESDDATRRFLAPLLTLEPVQHLLVSFVRDPSKSFEDHVWDPTTHEVLGRLHGAGVDASGSREQANSIFENALLAKTQGGQGPVDMQADDGAELLAEVDAAQTDGKTKFKRGDHYAAMNAFKKSVLALLKYHEDQYYGDTIDPREWEEEELRERYATLCCNVAVCAIKLRDGALVRRYAAKALRVDERSSKAIYALAKVNLMEQLLDDARAEAKRGLALYPDNGQFAKLLKEIERAEMKQLEDRADLLSMKELSDKLGEEARKRREQEEAEQRAKLERAAEVTRLPTLHNDESAYQRLNTYFMRIKQSLRVTFDQLHNPDNGEPPLFECNILNGSTGATLATGVRASSKKVAKQTAAKAAIMSLWKAKRDAGKLLPEDQEHWDDFEKAQRDGTSLPFETPTKPMDDDNAIVSPPSHQDERVVQLTLYERQSEPAALLHQLTMQRRLQVEFNIEDVTPSKFEPLFKCTCVINGEELASATAPSKKKAKAEAARRAMDAAVATGIIQYVRTVGVVDEQPAGAAEVA